MDVLVDMIDPGQPDEMVMLTAGRILPGQLYLVRSLEVVELADGFPVGRDHVHLFLSAIRAPSFSFITGDERQVLTKVARRTGTGSSISRPASTSPDLRP